MRAPNPWTVVPAADHARYLGPEGLDLRSTLDGLFQEAYLSAQPDRLLVVGCATGDGLEHVDPSVTGRVVGLDVNLQYLAIARQRFFHLGPRLELYCTDAETWRAPPGAFDLVHAALVLEYLHPEPLVRRIAGWLADGGACSIVLRLPGGEAPEPPSQALRLIERAARPVPPEELVRLFEHYGLPLRRQRVVQAPGGTSLWAGAFGRAEARAK
ncbi:Methyltransferase type 12 [Anaeromyxobacter dehalogenans 2CP-1]|uniref:Methyltransferase type 12 n=1 Tax=Anaeromyxobacter dehalogenans (strain ATCC BAA-258 / DSM 21875 / 2CP-1) TaxID=455488 RepID=B8J7E7_ANAD2|nr:class I SAM-dependent methyltransferase [Anaeromyxobacter dehalogenans]ACL67127.1 Methyltransferase type 12 [Anaeromyxobacter dehalogenans 2CP-1]